MEQDPLMTVSVLVTREEYSKASAETRRKERGRFAPWITAAGAVLMVLGIAGAFFGKLIFLSFSAALCLILLGVFLVCYDGFFALLFDGAAAAREYDETEELRFATTYSFTDRTVRVENGRVAGNLPLNRITRWNETPELLLFSYGREFHFAIPKRLLSPEQNRRLPLLLQNAAQESRA